MKLDDIERRAKAIGWTADRDGEWLHLSQTRGRTMRFASYRERDGQAKTLSGDLCPHEKALLERDGEVMDTLRALVAELDDIETRLGVLRVNVTHLIGLMTEGNRG
jgi:hypothetical protein